MIVFVWIIHFTYNTTEHVMCGMYNLLKKHGTPIPAHKYQYRVCVCSIRHAHRWPPHTSLLSSPVAVTPHLTWTIPCPTCEPFHNAFCTDLWGFLLCKPDKDEVQNRKGLRIACTTYYIHCNTKNYKLQIITNNLFKDSIYAKYVNFFFCYLQN